MAAIDAIAYMDRRIRTGAVGLSAVYAGGVTTWTLPYSVAVDGTEGELRVGVESTKALAVSTRPAANQIAVAGSDLSTVPVIIGVLYNFSYTPSRCFLRDRQGNADLTAQVTLHHMAVKYCETISIGARVKRVGHSLVSSLAKLFATPSAGELTIPVHADAKDVTVTIQDYSSGALALSGITWSGTVRSPKGRRV